MILLIEQSGFFLADLQRQVDWYRDRAGSEIAVGYVDAVETTLHRLARMPGIGRPRFWNRIELHGMRSWRVQKPYQRHMKTASVQQVPQKWSQILEWLAAGEEVEVTEQEKVIARVVPATSPDFLARAKKIWSEQPAGKPLSELVDHSRGGPS
jgi:antitoxin (DNA-binding transcriptional repressor) of toxin-antitoxin stability system